MNAAQMNIANEADPQIAGLSTDILVPLFHAIGILREDTQKRQGDGPQLREQVDAEDAMRAIVRARAEALGLC